MIKIIFAALLALSSSSRAAYVGKSDLGLDPSALGMRDLQNGVWRVGLQYPLWHLQAVSRVGRDFKPRPDAEVFHVSAFYASRLERQNAIYGPSVGVNFGAAAAAAIDKIEAIVTVSDKLGLKTPPFLSKLGDWTSFDVYGGYAPVVGGGDKPWAYGVGGKLRIPITDNLMGLYDWATGTQAKGTGQKGL